LPRRVHRSLLLSVCLLAFGVVSLMLGIDTTKDKANGALVIAGTLAIPLGVALLCPLAVRMLAPAARRLPVAGRLALRDLARYQARASAALAAISLALGISIAIVVAAAAAEDRSNEGNLSDRQVLVRSDAGLFAVTADRTAADLERRQAAVDDIAGAVAGTRVVPLQMARAEPTAGDGPRPPIALARRVGRETYRYAGPLYVATPEVLEYLHIDPRSIRAGADILSVQQGPLYYMDAKDAPVAAGNVQIIDAPRYSSAPRSLITTEALTRYGWTSAATAWLVEAPTTLTADQLTHARSIAADAGLTVESRRTQHALTDLRVGSTVVGFLLALGIVAMTVGLVRSEAATELRVLTASGASRRIRRAIAGVTAGTLAILGVFLGAAAAYAGLMAGYAEDLSALRPIPLPNLAAIAIGLPLVAATAAWLVAGKEPGSLARSPVE
jgi:putative ABC transport system permease protein